MRVFIPPLGTVVELMTDWTFDLYDERRNDTMLDIVDPANKPPAGQKWWARKRNYGSCQQITLPAGSRLSFDRIYIRSGQGNYDSITFKLQRWMGRDDLPANRKQLARFWVKLKDVNDMSVMLIEERPASKEDIECSDSELLDDSMGNGSSL